MLLYSLHLSCSWGLGWITWPHSKTRGGLVMWSVSLGSENPLVGGSLVADALTSARIFKVTLCPRNKPQDCGDRIQTGPWIEIRNQLLPEGASDFSDCYQTLFSDNVHKVSSCHIDHCPPTSVHLWIICVSCHQYLILWVYTVAAQKPSADCP